MNIYDKFKNNFNGLILTNEPLKNHSSFKIGGNADLMVTAKNLDDLKNAVNLCIDYSIPFFLLGGGTNIIFHDNGFRGVIIKNLCTGYNINDKEVFTESGSEISKLAENTVLHGLKGLEYSGGLPGTVGGAIVGNAGAYGHSIGDVLESAALFLLKEREIINAEKDFFNFKYRYSRLKDGSVKAIVLSANLKLEHGNTQELMEIIKKDRYKRRTEHPPEPSAGCIFKNIDLSRAEQGEKFTSLEKFIVHNKLPAGKLVDILGLKGKSCGGAMVSELHGNYIVNTGNAGSEDVKELIGYIKDKVFSIYNIELTEEVLFIGEYVTD